MGYLLHSGAALGIQVLGQLGPTWPVLSAWWALALFVLPHALAHWSMRSVLAGRFRRGAGIARLVPVSSVMVYAVLILASDWLEGLRGLFGSHLDGEVWLELSTLVSLLPFAVLQVLAIDAQAWLQAGGGRGRQSMRRFGLRMFATSFLPLVVYLALVALVGTHPVLRSLISEVELYHATALALMVALLALGFPYLIARAWDTSPLGQGWERETLESMAKSAHFRCKDIRVWNTGQLMANAAIVGVAGRRLVLFSDRLLGDLGPRQLGAVFAHEIGHAKCHHAMLFLCWGVSGFLGFSLAAPEGELAEALCLAGGLVIWVLGFGWLSRRAEQEADLYSLNLTGDLMALVSSLGQVAHPRRARGGWRHFSPLRRIRFLEEVEIRPAVGVRFKRQMNRWRWAGWVSLAVTGALQIEGMVNEYPGQRARADLVMGDYHAAHERYSKLGSEHATMAALAAVGESLVQSQGSEAGIVGEGRVERALVRALEGGRLDRAEGLAGLLVIRGNRAAQDLSLWFDLERMGQGRSEQAKALLGELPEHWSQALAGP